MRNRSLFCGVTFLFIIFLLTPFARAERYEFLSMWPANANNWYFDKPLGVALDGAGNVYVADTNNNRVKQYGSDGSYMATWGSHGTGDGQFAAPAGVAVDGDGNIFVADTGNNRIQKLNPDGSFAAQWGTPGTANGEFDAPGAIIVDGSGYVYVADTGNDRIQKFDNNGAWMATFGGAGSGDGQLAAPKALALDIDGSVFVADTGNNRIQKFAATTLTQYDYAAQFGGAGTGDGQFDAPGGLALDGSRNVFVADTGNNRIQKFTHDGTYQVYTYAAQFGTLGSGDDQFSTPGCLAMDTLNHDHLWVADTYNDRIRSHDTTSTPIGALLTSWSSSGYQEGELNTPGDLIFDDAGNVILCDANNSRIQKFGADGSFIQAWGQYGTGNGEFNLPGGIARDADGNIYIADTHNNRIQKFDADMNFQWASGSLGSGSEQLDTPYGIAVSTDTIYVADSRNNRIQMLDLNGTFVGSFGTPATPGVWLLDGELNGPGDVSLDASGNIYVTDSYNIRVQMFDSNHAYVRQWGSYGTGPGQFNDPRYLIVDPLGAVYVTDSGNDRLQKFLGDGTFVLTFGQEGAEQGAFNWPRGLRVDSQGKLYVVDSHNDRIQIFRRLLTVTTQAGAGGGISATTEVAQGANVTVTITPDTGYAVSDVTVDGQSVGAVTSYDLNNVTADHTVVASFAVATFTVTTETPGGHGSITEGQTVNYGGSFTATITPDTGYDIADVTVNGVSQGATGSVELTNITQNYTISATFSIQTFTVTTQTPDGHGTITEGQTVNYGGSFTATISPSTGYAIADVTVNGVSQGATGSVELTNITQNYTISATFTPIILKITASVSPANTGTITPSGEVLVQWGHSQAFTIAPKPGHKIKAVLVNGVDQGKLTGYTFPSVTVDLQTIEAQFEQSGASLAPVYLLLLDDTQAADQGAQADETDADVDVDAK